MLSKLRWIGAAATACITIAVEVSPDQAVANLSAWAEKNGLPSISRIARGPVFDWIISNLLWIGISLALLLLLPDIRKGVQRMRQPRDQNRRNLITKARAVTSEIAKSTEGSEGFGDSIEKNETYYALFPYLSEEFKIAMQRRGRTAYATDNRGGLYPLARHFLNEIDRLEKEWKLR